MQGKKGQKNWAGRWLLEKLAGRIAGIGMAHAAVLGCAMGIMVGGIPLVGRLVQAHGGWPALGVMGLTLGVTWFVLRRTDATWGRGLAAERRVGDHIEHALVRPGCAFAHDVKEALEGVGGNVDHVVLTGAGVWVVETKAAWLDDEPFQDALRQTAANVRRVRRKLNRPDVPVRAALVIAEEGLYEKDCDSKGETVTAFKVASFWQRLQEECGEGDGASKIRTREELAREVWSLGSTRHLHS